MNSFMQFRWKRQIPRKIQITRTDSEEIEDQY